jgi:Fic family protein
MAFIHANKGWPNLDWDAGEVTPGLVRARHKQGLLLGRMRQLGFALQAEAAVEVLTSDVVQSSAIEGERLDQADVRSSIARRLGLPDGAARRASMPPATATTHATNRALTTPRGLLGPNSCPGWGRSFLLRARSVVATSIAE